MLNYAIQFFKSRIFFHTLYLWNEVGDSPPPLFFPNCFEISDTSNSLSDWRKILLTIYRLNLPRTQCLSYPPWKRGCEHNSEIKNHILFGFLHCVLLYVCYTFFEKCHEFCALARAVESPLISKEKHLSIDKSPDNPTRDNAFFRSRSEKHIFFDVDVVVKKKSNRACGFAYRQCHASARWSVEQQGTGN